MNVHAPHSRVTLRQLEAFVSVMLAGGISAAAQRLARTQSAVSLAVQELEAALQAKLFERVGRGVRPTEAARRLMPWAVELVDRAVELPALVGEEGAASVRLAVGASRTIGPLALPALLARHCRARPALSAEVAIANTGELVARVRDFSLDVAFVEGDVQASGLQVEPWLRDELVLFVRAGHPALGGKGRRAPAGAELSLEALRGASWALREPGSGTRETFLRAMTPLIGLPRVGIEISDPLALAEAVRQGDWFGCVSRRAVAGDLDAGRLVDVTPSSPALRRVLGRRFSIVTHPERRRTSAVAELIEAARAFAREADGGEARRAPTRLAGRALRRARQQV